MVNASMQPSGPPRPEPLLLDWHADALAARLAPLWPGLDIEFVARTVSTNSTLLARARSAVSPDGAGLSPCVLVAEQQTGGRGRLGRSWQSQRGASLTFSLALPLALSDWSGLSLAVGVALAEALDGDGDAADGRPPRSQATARPSVRLKWPNDLWLVAAEGGRGDGAMAATGRKLGGILIETVAVGEQRLAVIGIGINVLPFSAEAAFDTGIACLNEVDPQASAPRTLMRVLPPLARALRTFEQAGFAAFAARFAARDALLDRAVRLLPAAARGGDGVGGPAPDETVDGWARGVDATGALRLHTPAGRLLRVIGGEVSVRLAEPPQPPPGGVTRAGPAQTAADERPDRESAVSAVASAAAALPVEPAR